MMYLTKISVYDKSEQAVFVLLGDAGFPRPTAPTIHLAAPRFLPRFPLSQIRLVSVLRVMRRDGVGSTAGRDHLPFNRFERDQRMDQSDDVLGPRQWTSDFHSLPTEAARVQLEFDETLFIYHHFVHKVMDNYSRSTSGRRSGKSIRFNRSENGISAWINRMMYSALDRGHPTFTHFPTDKQHLWFRQFVQEFNWNSDETLFIYHHFVHKVMDNYGKQIHEWKKK
ncbi:hypothetical protein Bca52824_056452 [Brassica carinata]|uniref:Uncharacterized protein n=1 Tax=Brassica carinata TaxID=52824 RepID=A0A8X7QQG8_BRACI|nr:hypothetical protein Bca52824_056452 [Brassica carinata]